MTPELKIRAAKLLGWYDIEKRPHPFADCGKVLTGKFGLKSYINVLPNYDTDRNHWPELWAKMDEKQIDKLMVRLFEEFHLKRNVVYGGDVIYRMAAIIFDKYFTTQYPRLVEIWCDVMEGK
jgi:hypothetical protein